MDFLHAGGVDKGVIAVLGLHKVFRNRFDRVQRYKSVNWVSVRHTGEEIASTKTRAERGTSLVSIDWFNRFGTVANTCKVRAQRSLWSNI